MKSRKAKMSRLEKAKTNYSLSLVAYMLHPTREGKAKMKQAAQEFAAAQIEHQCECTRCLTIATRKGRNLLVHGKDLMN